MANSERKRLGSSSAASTSSQSSDSEHIDVNAQGSSSLSDLKRIYEQRRIRHIVCILVRNLELPDTQTSRHRQTPLRPTAHRSISITSNHSTHTLKRTPSNRTLRASVRRRASSVASIPHTDDEDDNQHRLSRTYQPPSLFLPWDTDSLRRSINARFTYAFVSFADTKSSRTIYRTPVTRQSGLHHAWGNTSGSDIESDGIDLSEITNEDGSQNHLRISLWAATQLAVDSLSLEHDSKRIIEPGSEESNGFELVWERDVKLQSMSKVEKELSNVSLTLPENSMILGMRLPLAQVHLTETGSGEQAQDSKNRDDTGKTGISKSGSVTQYYVVSPESSVDRNLSENDGEPALEKGLIRKLLKDGTLKRGYDIADILQILQLQRQMLEENEGIDNTGLGCSSMLAGKEDSGVHRIVQLGENKERQRVLIAKRDTTREIVKQKRREIHERNEALHRRRARLEIARRLLTNRQKVYEELRKKMTQLSKVRLNIEAKIYARRVVMLRQVEYIYPIDLIDGAQLLFGIVDIPLMNRDGNEDNHTNKEKRSGAKVDQSDDIVSSALGMVGQMVALISAYTDALLHYPIATAGSRSVIQDGISVMSGPRAFPLYSKGVERYRYEYGHFLLNKDIEQLMNHAGITILDIRNTLPNLKNLIVTLTASSQVNSKLSRRHHIGSEMISLPNTKAESLGMGRPTGTANDKYQQGDQIGYGAVVENQSILGHTKRSTAGSRWGMSLLGWGSSTNTGATGASSPSKPHQQISNDTQSNVPTVRTLGRSG